MNQQEFARLVGVSSQAVGDWLREGMPCRWRGGRGRGNDIDAEEALGWLAKRGIRPNVARESAVVTDGMLGAGDPDASGDATASYQSARARRELAVAEMAELDLRRRRGELIELDGVVTAVEDIGTRIRVALEALADTLAPRLASISDEATVKAILADEIEHTLQALSDGLALLAEEGPASA